MNTDICTSSPSSPTTVSPQPCQPSRTDITSASGPCIPLSSHPTKDVKTVGIATMPLSSSSPKRKRDPLLQVEVCHRNEPILKGQIKTQLQIPPTTPTSSPTRSTNMRLNTSINGVQHVIDPEDNGSPRTKVAYHFQGLQLEDGGDVSKLSLDLPRTHSPKPTPRFEIGAGDEENIVRKRMRVLERHESNRMQLGGRELEIPETPMSIAQEFRISIGPERSIDPMIEEKARGVRLHNEVDPVIFKGSPVSKARGAWLGRAYPSINRLVDSKSRMKPKVRMGSPPLFGAAEASLELGKGTADREIVDEERAALTWHDDEITGHDPNDPDDDGEGINGIGFKPTAAEAYSRTQRRRQQMLEYRNREAREARARRSERRRGLEFSLSGSNEEKEVARRVRFMEAEKMSIVSSI